MANSSCGMRLPAYSGAFLLTVDNFGFFTYNWSFFAYNFSFLTYSYSFFAYSGKVRLIRALRGCKQRSLTVSKKAPTVSKKASPVLVSLGGSQTSPDLLETPWTSQNFVENPPKFLSHFPTTSLNAFSEQSRGSPEVPWTSLELTGAPLELLSGQPVSPRTLDTL